MKPKLSESYEAVSKHLGWKDWNTASAKIGKENLDEVKSFVKAVHARRLIEPGQNIEEVILSLKQKMDRGIVCGKSS